MHNEIKAGQRKNRYGFWYGWTMMGSILERKKVAGMVGVVVQMATRECLCLVPALIDYAGSSPSPQSSVGQWLCAERSVGQAK
jgi:hypothetical protein